MLSKKSGTPRPHRLKALLAILVIAAFFSGDWSEGATTVPPPGFSARKIRAIDADNHNILLNRLGAVTLVIGTSEDSQDAAREAGKAMYPFEGRPDFQLMVVVDLRDSLATWAPSIVYNRMRASLDDEAIELKPYFLANGNKSNPRSSCHVVPDFKGAVCPLLGWPDSSGDLRGVLFGADGREIKRWDKITDMNQLQGDVRAALEALIKVKTANVADASKARATKPIQLPGPKPLQPAVPPTAH
jgi:hypothetical protein